MDTRCDELLRTVLAEGTIDKVAEALEVESTQIYRWIGGLEAADREPTQVVARLRQLRLFAAYFARRIKASAAAWQQ
jgi:hypothetical protein